MGFEPTSSRITTEGIGHYATLTISSDFKVVEHNRYARYLVTKTFTLVLEADAGLEPAISGL